MIKFKIGDYVKPINSDSLYCYYCNWANKHNLTNWEYDDYPKKFEKEFIIVAIGNHLGHRSLTLCGIQSITTKQTYIYNENNLELISNQLELQF